MLNIYTQMNMWMFKQCAGYFEVVLGRNKQKQTTDDKEMINSVAFIWPAICKQCSFKLT